MRVDELAVMMNLAGQVGISFVGRLEDNLGVVDKLVAGEVDLAEGALANKASQGVVANGL